MKGWPQLPRMNPCLPCMVGNPSDDGGCGPSVHIDMPGAHSARGRGRTIEVNRNPGKGPWGHVVYNQFPSQVPMREPERERQGKKLRYYTMPAGWYYEISPGNAGIMSEIEYVGPHGSKAEAEAKLEAALRRLRARRNPDARRARPTDLPIKKIVTSTTTKTERAPRDNPRLMVLNPHSAESLVAQAEKSLRRRLTAKERSNAMQAIKEFRTFHGRLPESLLPVDAPPGSPLFLNYVGHELKHDYEVRIGSERRGKWTHSAGDHGGRKRTTPAIIASIPGRTKHNTVMVEPKGAKTFFKPTHGLMG